MSTLENVANYFLATQPHEESDLTCWKLQRLCAYAQRISLYVRGLPLFEEDMQAWKQGPVFPELFEKYSKYLQNTHLPIIKLNENINEIFSQEEKHILRIVDDLYNILSPYTLRQKSLEDFPGDFGSMKIIDKENIKKYSENDPEYEYTIQERMIQNEQNSMKL